MKTLKILSMLVVVLALFFVVNVARAERIVSDPWISGVDNLPETCEMAKNGGSFISFPVYHLWFVYFYHKSSQLVINSLYLSLFSQRRSISNVLPSSKTTLKYPVPFPC